MMKGLSGSFFERFLLDIILITLIDSSNFSLECRNRGKGDFIFSQHLLLAPFWPHRELKATNILLFHVYKEGAINAAVKSHNLRSIVRV